MQNIGPDGMTYSMKRSAWLCEEVTDDERYYNFNLAQKPYREWR